MIAKLAELNRVLLATKDLVDEAGRAVRASVIDRCKGTVIEARLPKHEDSIAFAELIGFVTTEAKAIRLTEVGMGFLELNPEGLYDLSESQKKLLLRTCYLQGAMREQTREVLRAFSQALGGETLRWNLYDSPAFQHEWTAEQLFQIGLLQRRDQGWEVEPDFMKAVMVLLEEGDGWSEESFREYLKEKEEVGKLAEEIVKAYEIERLRKIRCHVLAHCVRRISGIRVNAGYDIESFDQDSGDLAYDRFIEVKGSRAARMRFFWTHNEIQVAKRLGDRYWIYFQGGLDVAKGTARNEPILLQNPVSSILMEKRFMTTPQGLVVEANMTGRTLGKA